MWWAHYKHSIFVRYYIANKCQIHNIFSPILGAFTVTRELYPLGFYLVIIAKTDDMICQTPLKSITGFGDSFPVIFDRVKDIELNIVRKITQQDYVIAVLGHRELKLDGA